jgi:hypothetical protein
VVVLKDLFSELNLNSTLGSLCGVRSVDKSQKYRTITWAFELLLHLSQGQNVYSIVFSETLVNKKKRIRKSREDPLFSPQTNLISITANHNSINATHGSYFSHDKAMTTEKITGLSTNKRIFS